MDSLDLLRTLTCIIKDYFPDINPEFRSMSGGAFLYSFTYRDVGIEILPCEGYLIIRPKSLNHSGVEVEVVYSSIEELENDFLEAGITAFYTKQKLKPKCCVKYYIYGKQK